MGGSAETGWLSVTDGSGGGVCRKKKRRISRAGGFWGEGKGGEGGGGGGCASDIMRLNNTGKARAMEMVGSFYPFPGTRCRQGCTRSDSFFAEQLGRCFSFKDC